MRSSCSAGVIKPGHHRRPRASVRRCCAPGVAPRLVHQSSARDPNMAVMAAASAGRSGQSSSTTSLNRVRADVTHSFETLPMSAGLLVVRLDGGREKVRTICPLGARPEPGNSGYSPRHRMLPLIKVFRLNELGCWREVKGESCNCTITEELTTANPEKCVEDHTGLPGLGLSHRGRNCRAVQTRVVGIGHRRLLPGVQMMACAMVYLDVVLLLDRLKLGGPRPPDGSGRLPWCPRDSATGAAGTAGSGRVRSGRRVRRSKGFAGSIPRCGRSCCQPEPSRAAAHSRTASCGRAWCGRCRRSRRCRCRV